MTDTKKKNYEKPNIEIIDYDFADVISTSDPCPTNVVPCESDCPMVY